MKMVTTPYQRGRSREYKALRLLRAHGWVCSRSAMSHGPVDIFAAKSGRALLLQIKSGRSRMRKLDRDQLQTWAKAFEAQAEIWYFKRGGSLTRSIVYEPSSGRRRIPNLIPTMQRTDAPDSRHDYTLKKPR